MSLITLSSARGAPGVTTTALGLALAWQRPVLIVEADTAASSAILAGYFGGQKANDRGLLDLAIGHRHGSLEQALLDALLPLPGAEHAHVIPGLAHPEQAAAMADAWTAISEALLRLDEQGIDVIVDAGRIGALDGPIPMVARADLSLLVTRTNLPAVAATVSRCPQLTAMTRQHGPNTASSAMLIVGDGQPFSSEQLADIAGIPVVGHIAFDPAHAAVLSEGKDPGKSWTTSPLAASYRSTASAITDHIEASRDALAASPNIDLTDPPAKRSLRSAIAGFNKRSAQKETVGS